MSREELKILLKDMLTIEVTVTFTAGYGESQNVEASILLDGEVISNSQSTIFIPESSHGE